MPLFMCSKCKCVDNTATADFWSQQITAMRAGAEVRPLCTECHTGAWHGAFPKRPADGMFVEEGTGFLHHTQEDPRAPHLKRVGRVVNGEVVGIEPGEESPR